MEDFIYLLIFAVYSGTLVFFLNWNYKNCINPTSARVSKIVKIITIIMAVLLLLFVVGIFLHVADAILRIYYTPFPGGRILYYYCFT